jgi:hypothetical protein
MFRDEGLQQTRVYADEWAAFTAARSFCGAYFTRVISSDFMASIRC